MAGKALNQLNIKPLMILKLNKINELTLQNRKPTRMEMLSLAFIIY
jgi:hypothetical protein